MPYCPKCGSRDNKRTNWGKQTLQFFGSAIISAASQGKLNSPGPEHSKYKCNCCGHEWQVD